jgi:hypothetical protein
MVKRDNVEEQMVRPVHVTVFPYLSKNVKSVTEKRDPTKAIIRNKKWQSFPKLWSRGNKKKKTMYGRYVLLA